MLLKKTEYKAKIKNIKNKIRDITNLATKTTRNAKINEVKGKIPSITNLATAAALTAVEKKRSNVIPEYNTKIKEIENKITDHNHEKYIITPEFNKLTAKNFAARLAQANLVTKTDFNNKLINFNKRINSKKTKQNIY